MNYLEELRTIKEWIENNKRIPLTSSKDTHEKYLANKYIYINKYLVSLYRCAIKGADSGDERAIHRVEQIEKSCPNIDQILNFYDDVENLKTKYRKKQGGQQEIR